MSNKKRTDTILVVDVEATCWEHDTDRGDQRGEIIEIGVSQWA